MIRNLVLGIAVILLMSGAASAQNVAGVWRLDEAKTTGADAKTTTYTQPNLYLFTKGYYSVIRVEGDAPRMTDDLSTMNAQQLQDTFVKNFTANAGTYDVKAGTLTMKVMIAKSPSYMAGGNWSSYKVKLSGNKMTLTSVATKSGAVKDPATMTLTRVE